MESHKGQLSSDARNLAIEIFDILDTDNTKKLNRADLIEFWYFKEEERFRKSKNK